MKKVTLLTLVLSAFISANAQNTFMETFAGSSDAKFSSIRQTSDSGFVYAAATNSFGAGNNDVYLVKTNSTGNIMWSKTYGGTGNDYAYAVEKTNDGGFIIAGNTSSFGAGSNDIYIIRTNSSGDTIWTKTYGGSNNDGIGSDNSIQRTSDGNYIFVGSTKSFGQGDFDIYLVKINDLGDTLWTRTFGNSSSNTGNSVKQTSDGGYIIAGTTMVGSREEMNVVKTDSLGNLVWSNLYVIPVQVDYTTLTGLSILQTNNGGYTIEGRMIHNYNSYSDAYIDIISLDNLGAINTSNVYLLNYNSIIGMSGYGTLAATNDGGHIITGYLGILDTFGVVSSYFLLLKKEGGSGASWTKTFGGTSMPLIGTGVIQTNDGGYAVSGISFNSSLYMIIKTDSLGNGGCNSNSITLYGSSSGFIPIIGQSPNTIQSGGGIVHSTPTLIGTGSITVNNPCSVGISEINNHQSSIEVYPNPFTSTATITFSEEQKNTTVLISDILGNTVQQLTTNNQQLILDMSSLAKGIYFLQINNDKGRVNKKLIKQ